MVIILKKQFMSNGQKISDEEKIVCIGMFKTGTTSVGILFERLGYNAIYDFWGVLNGGEYDEIKKTPEAIEKIQKKSQNYDAFADAPWLFMYEELEQWYPNSKFILTLRDVQDLVISEMRQYCMSNDTLKLPDASYYVDRYKSHVNLVRSYFHGREGKLLEVNIDNDDFSKKICNFLDKKHVDIMPHVNSGRDKWGRKKELEFRKALHNKFGDKSENSS